MNSLLIIGEDIVITMSTDNNYYSDLWTKEGSHGDKFWKKVDFNHKDYKLQEHIFRETLVSLWNLWRFHIHDELPHKVLEVGVGTGRMTKIMLEVFPDIGIYETVDIDFDLNEFAKVRNSYRNLGTHFGWDITGDRFKRWFKAPDYTYDFILASEVFMHIKPEDIEDVIKQLSSLLRSGGKILNIDWFFAPEPSEWCFIHDYDKLYRDNGLHPIFTADIEEIKQKLFCYGA